LHVGICEKAAGRVGFREKCDNVFELMLDYTNHPKKQGAQICAGAVLGNY